MKAVTDMSGGRMSAFQNDGDILYILPSAIRLIRGSVTEEERLPEDLACAGVTYPAHPILLK